MEFEIPEDGELSASSDAPINLQTVLKLHALLKMHWKDLLAATRGYYEEHQPGSNAPLTAGSAGSILYSAWTAIFNHMVADLLEQNPQSLDERTVILSGLGFFDLVAKKGGLQSRANAGFIYKTLEFFANYEKIPLTDDDRKSIRGMLKEHALTIKIQHPALAAALEKGEPLTLALIKEDEPSSETRPESVRSTTVRRHCRP